MADLLLVDDNIEATRPLAMLLRFAKHQVDCVASGDEALKYLQNKLPSLVVLDVMMPGMDGMEVLRRIRSDPRTRSVAVVMFSAVSDPVYRNEAIGKGADDYIVKGIAYEEMRARFELAAENGHPVAPPADGTSADGATTNLSKPDYQ